MFRYQSWTVTARIVAGFCLASLIVAIVGVIGAVYTNRVNGMLNEMYESNFEPVVEAMSARREAQAFSRTVLEHVIESDEAEMSAIEGRQAEHAKNLFAHLERFESTMTTDEERAAAAGLRKAWPIYTAHVGRARELSRQVRTAEAMQIVRTEAETTFAEADRALETLVGLNQALAKTAYEDSDAAAMTAQLSLGAVALAGTVVSLLLGWLVGRGIGRQLRTVSGDLRDGAAQVAAASGQVSTAAQSLSSGATEQAASLEETSATIEEMASMARRNAEGSERAAELMRRIDAQVKQSNGALRSMVESMDRIRDASSRVAKIIKTIDEIAFQTNILALNAAVEAARAGEAGMGFAVVADEVRTLAQRSAQAAKDTASLIEEALQSAGEGSERVGAVDQAIQSIVTSVSEAEGVVAEVSAASRQQSQGVEQIAQAVTQMEKVTQTNAATAEESAAASEELNAQAEASLASVGRLEAMVGGQGAVAGTAPRVPAPRAGFVLPDSRAA